MRAWLVALSITGSLLAADPEPLVLPLWVDGAPGDNGLSGPERGSGCVANISKPDLTIHLPPEDRRTGAAVLVIPGGGYGNVCLRTEGEQIAPLLLERGIAAVVLKYRLPNRGHHEIPGADARRAMRQLRHLAGEFDIDPKRIGAWGFSAGGHLCATLGTAFDAGDADAEDPVERESCRPDFLILFYPVVSMEAGRTHAGSRNNLLGPDAGEALVARYSAEKNVDADTPPTFLLHATDDRAVPVENSLGFYRALRADKIPATLLIYERGGHGPNAFRKNPSWAPAFDAWLGRRGVKLPGK